MYKVLLFSLLFGTVEQVIGSRRIFEIGVFYSNVVPHYGTIDPVSWVRL